MHRVILSLFVAALAVLLLWAVYHTGFGILVGGLLPDDFWTWIHTQAPAAGAESGYDLEFLILAGLCLLLAALIVLPIDRRLRRFRR